MANTIKHIVRTLLSSLIIVPDEFNAEEWWECRNRALSPSTNGLSKITIHWNRLKYKTMNRKWEGLVPLSAQIDGLPVFPHGLNGVFISQGAHIGKGCVIFHQVTIGSNTLADSRGQGAPTIGDNAYIGCGAKIIGGCSIGHNVRVGANCVVVDDIPDCSTVVLAKPLVIRHKERSNEFVAYKPDVHDGATQTG